MRRSTNLTDAAPSMTKKVRGRTDRAVLFVRVISTVRTTITAVMFVYTRTGLAGELVLRAVIGDTVHLIFTIAAVLLSVTSQEVRETSVIAGYLVFLAARTVLLVLA